MKSYSISFFFLALNVFVSANPLIKRLKPFGEPEPNPFGSPSPDGGLLTPTNPSGHEGETCSVRLVRKLSHFDIFSGGAFAHSEILNRTSFQGT